MGGKNMIIKCPKCGKQADVISGREDEAKGAICPDCNVTFLTK